MDTRDGTIYDSLELAKIAGVPDDDLVTGSREALEELLTRLVFTKGSFKTLASPPADPAVDPVDELAERDLTTRDNSSPPVSSPVSQRTDQP